METRLPDFATRSHEAEIIDDFAMEGEELIGCLRSIERVNRWLGGNRVLTDGFGRLVATLNRGPGPGARDAGPGVGARDAGPGPGARDAGPGPASQGASQEERPFVVWDLGCGGGDGLRALAAWGRKAGRPLEFVGLDANPAVIEYARQQSRDWPEIEWRCQDILNLGPDDLASADIVTFNLCLHHFTDQQILGLLEVCRRAGTKAVLINDLHRSAWAYHLFRLFCFAFRIPRIAREDGLLSVRKGFRHEELVELSSRFTPSVSVRWRWAFRYQVLLPLDREPPSADRNSVG